MAWYFDKDMGCWVLESAPSGKEDINSLEGQKSYYNRLIGTGKLFWPRPNQESLYNQFIQWYDGGVILDLGCYEGHYIPWFNGGHLRPGTSVEKIICCDIIDKPFELIKNKYKDVFNSGLLDFRLISGKDLKGIETNSVDFIFSIDALVRIGKEEHLVYSREFARVLRPNGKFFIHLLTKETTIHRIPDGLTMVTNDELCKIYDWASIETSTRSIDTHAGGAGIIIMGKNEHSYK